MTTLRELLLLLAIAAVPAALSVALHPDLANRQRAGLSADAVRVAEVATWNGILWLDAREPAAFAQGHVPGALHFDETAFNESLGAVIAQWTPGRPIVIYCDSTACSRSRELAQRLREAGFSDVYHLHGGWEAWTAQHGGS